MFFENNLRSFYAFVSLFDILSKENALRLIDHWFNKIEFSDTHYHVVYSHFVFLCMKWLHLQIHLPCAQMLTSDAILEFGSLFITSLVVVICRLFLPLSCFNEQLLSHSSIFFLYLKYIAG